MVEFLGLQARAGCYGTVEHTDAHVAETISGPAEFFKRKKKTTCGLLKPLSPELPDF